MKLHSVDIVEKARLARKTGTSLRSIGKNLKVPSSTISKWVRDIPSDNHFYKKARLFEKFNKNKLINSIKDYKIDKNQAKLLLSLLYWCEGSKYPSTNRVAFSNSDFLMMRTFIKLLRKSFVIDEKKLRVRMQFHSTHDINKENKFWSNLLDIPLDLFEKPTITNPTKNMKRSDYRGTCTIKYYDVKLLLNIIGLYEFFGKRFERRGG